MKLYRLEVDIGYGWKAVVPTMIDTDILKFQARVAYQSLILHIDDTEEVLSTYAAAYPSYRFRLVECTVIAGPVIGTRAGTSHVANQPQVKP